MKGLFQNLGNMKTVNNLNIVFTLFFNFFEAVLFFQEYIFKIRKNMLKYSTNIKNGGADL